MNKQLAYIPNYDSQTISVINTAYDKVKVTITRLSFCPLGVAVSSDGKVYVTNEEGHPGMMVIDTATNTVTDTVDVGNGPFGVSVTPDGKKVYVANSGSNTVSVIDTGTNKVSVTVPVGSKPIAFGQFIPSPE